MRLELAENHRDLALVNMATDSKLRGVRPCPDASRGCDGVWSDYRTGVRSSKQDAETSSIRDLGRHTRTCCEVDGRSSDGRFGVSLARIVRDWVTSIGLEATAYGTHSMLRTKVTQIYKKTGDLRAVQLMLVHTRMDSTVRYLGVELEDVLAIAETIEIKKGPLARAARRRH